MLLKRGANRDLKSTEGKSAIDFGENLFSLFEIYYFDYNSFIILSYNSFLNNNE